MALPDQLSKGHTFVDGDIVDAASLNQAVDDASALKGIITEQTPLSGPLDSTHDLVLVYDDSAVGLRKAFVSALPSGVTSVAMTATPPSIFSVSGTPITTSGTLGLSLDNQLPNKFLCGPVSGLAATPAFRVISPADLPNSALLNIAAWEIDLDLGSSFQKSLDAGGTFRLKNGSPGQTIRVVLNNTGNFAVHWETDTGGGVVRWPVIPPATTSVEPANTLGTNKHDIFEFMCASHTIYYGSVTLNLQTPP